MQLYALDVNDKLEVARDANKLKNYTCLECGSIVRVRKGRHRQPHYYHISPNRECRLHGKGMAHLLAQYRVKESLPFGEAELECRFPSIGRIADVAWSSKKIIFEIQYSPITAKEVQARNRDYASIGYQVVWILSDARYNQKCLSAAEDFLQNFPCYFTNMTEEGEGIIYDQISIIAMGKRKKLLGPVEIDLSSPFSLSNQEVKRELPLQVQKKIEASPLCFGGDVLDRYFHPKEEVLDVYSTFEFLRNEEEKSKLIDLSDLLKGWVWRYIVAPYRSLLRLFLERASQ